MTEIWSAYDRKRKIIPNQVLIRGKEKPAGLYHLVVEAIIQHEDGDILFMKRSSEKENFSGFYEGSCGGSALYKESSSKAIYREIREETGLVPSRLQLLKQETVESWQGHIDKYLAIVDNKDIVYQVGETEHHVWVVPHELEDFYQNHSVVPSYIALIQEFILKK